MSRDIVATSRYIVYAQVLQSVATGVHARARVARAGGFRGGQTGGTREIESVGRVTVRRAFVIGPLTIYPVHAAVARSLHTAHTHTTTHSRHLTALASPRSLALAPLAVQLYSLLSSTAHSQILNGPRSRRRRYSKSAASAHNPISTRGRNRPPQSEPAP